MIPNRNRYIFSSSKRNFKKKTLLLDLDETLIHSTLKLPERYDFKMRVNIAGVPRNFYVIKRPHLDHFLQKVYLSLIIL